MRLRTTPTIAALLLATALTMPALSQGNDIPWNRGLTITRTSSDDNIRNVFRTLLQQNGLSVVFGPGVNQTVSFHLENVPLDAAFTQLIDRHRLVYSYDPRTRTVTINNAGGGAGGGTGSNGSTVFLTLQETSFSELTEALVNLGLGQGGLRFDERSRTLAVTGDAERVKQIQTLAANLEQARKLQASGITDIRGLRPDEVKVIPLRFTDVGESSRQFQGRTVTVPGIADTLRAILGLNEGTAPNLGTGGGGAGQASMPPEIGRPRISIDQRTNSVVVQGTPQAIAAVEKIIGQLDRPLQMVQIEVLIVTANIGVAKQLGVNWRGSQVNPGGTPNSLAVDTGTSGGRVTNGTGGDLFSSNGLDALSLLPSVSAAGGTAASFVIRGGQAIIEAQLQALASNDQARILSAPKLVTLDNITARITRSQNIYVQVDTSNPNGGFGGVGLEEIQTGLTLEITPSIVPAQTDRDQSLVRLNLRAQNSAPGTGSFGQIDVVSQEVQTNVLVPDSDTFVIGGLFDDSQIKKQSGVPGLKDIPILGALFRTDETQNSLGETIFFITPRIVDERTMLQSDIALRDGSAEYIRRARAQLSDGSDGEAKDAPLPQGTGALEEDE